MKIFDTLSSAEKELDTSGTVRMYVCGITVYDESHIGHARTIIVFDTLRRFLESEGATTRLIQNFTDVDDKIIDRAKVENVPADAISTRYIRSYFEGFDKLNVKRADSYPKATEYIQEMINLIKVLIDKTYAYVSKNGVYFSVSKFKEYGKLSKKKIDDLIAGARVEVDETKKDPLDFALWKFADDEPRWESPWGHGRPGWHIECSAMSLKELGPDFEIHGGGRDLIFPHHENEIAQSECYSGKNFAKIWMHVGMVTINGEKMSKSLGNTKSVDFVLSRWGPNIVRLFCLSGHYSKPVDYSEDLLKETMTKWRQVENCYIELLHPQKDESTYRPISLDEKVVEPKFTGYKNKFYDSLESDFNTPLALSFFFSIVNEANNLAAHEYITEYVSNLILPEFEKMLEVLGLKIVKPSSDESSKIDELIVKRNDFRAQKKYQEADEIRQDLERNGVILIDHKKRTLWIKQEKIGV